MISKPFGAFGRFLLLLLILTFPFFQTSCEDTTHRKTERRMSPLPAQEELHETWTAVRVNFESEDDVDVFGNTITKNWYLRNAKSSALFRIDSIVCAGQTISITELAKDSDNPVPHFIDSTSIVLESGNSIRAHVLCFPQGTLTFSGIVRTGMVKAEYISNFVALE